MSAHFAVAVLVTLAVAGTAIRSYLRHAAFRRLQVSCYAQWRDTGTAVPGWDQQWIWSQPAIREEPARRGRGAA